MEGEEEFVVGGVELGRKGHGDCGGWWVDVDDSGGGCGEERGEGREALEGE